MRKYLRREAGPFHALKLLFALFLLAAAATNTGCPHGHQQTYVSIVPGSISGTVRTYDGASVDGAIVTLSVDPLMFQKVRVVKVKADGAFSFPGLDPMRYYIGAYIDAKKDGSPTVTEDHIGGKLADEWDLENTFHPLVEEAKDTVIDIPLLAPFKMNVVENGTNSVDLNPKFSWNAYAGAAFYRLRVATRKQSMWVIDTPLTAKTYGTAPGSGEVLITPPEQLFEDTEYLWTVIAFREKFVPIAYCDVSRFFTITSRLHPDYLNHQNENYITEWYGARKKE